MPSQTDQFSGSNTLPPAELNPLQNPLLSENMRRWAEVYFNNPPERRDQAVAELLLDLEAEKARREGATGRISAAGEREQGSAFSANTSSETEHPELVRCKTCGHDNAGSQHFCGMCGAPVAANGSQTGASQSGENWEYETLPADAADPDAADDWESDSAARAYEETAPNTNELSLFQTVPRSDSSYDAPDWEYEPSPSQPYRIYIALVLAVMLGGLGYMAWRSMQANSQSHETSAPPPVATSEPEAPPTQAAENAKAEQPASSKNSAEAPAANPAEPNKTQAKVTRQEPLTKPTPAAEVTSHAPTRVAARGEEELSIAQRYLSGANGEGKDPAEASKWLWRSVAKHNDQATLLLADLYLRGDGVSKNCDQARVLLDSAARKGMSGAGERLRNLQAFGCQ